MPRLLEIAGVPQPIDSQARVESIRATLVRPRARTISAVRSPMVAVLTNNAANTQSAAPVSATLAAAAHRKVSVAEALDTRGSVTFRRTPLSEVIFLLSDLWHINIVAGENVSGEVSGAFHDAPLREVLAAVLTSSGYSYRKTGSSLVVLSADQVGADDPAFVSETLRLPETLRDDTSMLDAANLLLSERGRLQKIGRDVVLIIDTSERIDRVKQLFAGLTPIGTTAAPTGRSGTGDEMTTGSVPMVTQSGIAYFTPQFTEAEEMAESLRAALGENVIVAVYSQENRILVKGNPADLQLAADAIEQLDRPRAQVRITAMIYDVSLGELERIGTNWSRDLRAIADSNNAALADVTDAVHEAVKFSSDLAGTGATSAGIRTLTSTLEASVFLEALDSTSEAKLLADPSITVGDRRQASIRIVRRIPIVGANPVQNSTAVFTQTEFEEAGVILNVRPRISRDGTIELNVQPEYSVVAEITSTGPVIDSRTAETIVRVANGQMFVLGGLRQKSIVETQRGVPYLRDIKYLGRLFRSHSTDVRESELIVFLKPELITPYFNGKPREQRAAAVAGEQLDQIPYGESFPSTPCCGDKYCPNHHPRPRINGGSESLKMIGGDGMYEYPMYESEYPVEIIQQNPGALPDHNGSIPAVDDPSSVPAVDVVLDEGFPTLHIDPRVITLNPSRTH